MTGKYFIDENTAYRAKVRFGLMDSKTDKSLKALENGSADNTMAEDKWKHNEMNITISAGLEKRRGHGRVQGFYGGEVTISLATEKDKYEYGNDITSTYTAPQRYDFAASSVSTSGSYLIEDKKGMEFSFGVGAFAGVEYFFAPKISIGGELGWGINFSSEGTGTKTTEAWDGSSAEETEVESGGESSFSVDNLSSNAAGSIFLMFHF